MSDGSSREGFDLFHKLCRLYFFRRGIFGDRWARKFVLKDTWKHIIGKCIFKEKK